MRPGVALFVLLCLIAPPVSSAADQSPRELYDALNALRLDPAATYQLVTANRIELRRGDVELYFEEGKLAFFAPIDGQITGFVFSGRGHALAFPREPVEKQQMARFLGAPVLDQEFLSAYVRFTDDAAEDLLHQFRSAKLAPQLDSAFASLSDSFVSRSSILLSPCAFWKTASRKIRNPISTRRSKASRPAPLIFFSIPSGREQFLLGQRRKSGDHFSITMFGPPTASPAPFLHQSTFSARLHH